jgi:hypothetical protein
MTENPGPVTFTEDRVPLGGIEETVDELVDLYGGDMQEAPTGQQRQFTLPLRRGVPTAGAVLCTLRWEDASAGGGVLTLHCDREVDAPKVQRVALLIAGVIGALFFTMWPFFPNLGALAWLGGAVAIAVYLISLKKTAGGVAADFLRRLAKRQREMGAEP